MKIKHLVIAFLAFTAAVNFSCSKNDDNTGSASIVGTWELTKTTEVGTKTITKGEDVKTENINNTNELEAGKSAIVTFKSNGTYTLKNIEDELLTGQYNINGNKITLISPDIEDGKQEGVFSLSGNTLTIVFDYEDSYKSGSDNDIATITIKTKDTQTFNRKN